MLRSASANAGATYMAHASNSASASAGATYTDHTSQLQHLVTAHTRQSGRM